MEREVNQKGRKQGNGTPPGGVDPAPPARRAGAFCRRPGELLVERGEEVVGHFPRAPVDRARADLGELAADARLGQVAQARARAFALERHLRAAFAESRRAARSLE